MNDFFELENARYEKLKESSEKRFLTEKEFMRGIIFSISRIIFTIMAIIALLV